MLSTELEAFHINISTSEGNNTNYIFILHNLIPQYYGNCIPIQLAWESWVEQFAKKVSSTGLTKSNSVLKLIL